MIEGEEQELILNTLAEQPQEEIRTLEEDIYVIGVESLNGQAGDLTLKSINGEDLVGEGNIALQTPLTETQMDAVDSGIDSTKVAQIATNAGDITTLQNTKQDNLTQTQLNAVNSGIDQTKVAQIATNTGNISSNTNRITTIEGKIPSAASSSNQLTDKNYVDNSIATNTANYISDNGQPFQSYADLEAYSGPLTNNDYAFVVSTDAAGNLLYTRYKYNASQNLWAEEYTIANPTFTSDQWASINSGVTANDVSQIGTNKTDIATLTTSKQDALSQTQLDAVNSGINATKVQQIADNTTAIATKQDKLVAGTNIQIASDGKTISATDTKYTAGAGLTLTGTQFSVTEPVPAGFFSDTASKQEGEGTQFTLSNTTDAPIDGAELKGDTFQQTYTGKNKLGYTYASVKAANSGSDRVWNDTTKTMSYHGVDYKVNDDGSVLASGTASSVSFLNLVNPLSGLVSSTEYIMNGCPTGGSASTYSLRLYTGGSYAWDSGTGHQFTYDSQDIVRVNISGGTALPAGGLLFKPMIRLASVADDTYEQYVGGIPSPNPDYPQTIDTVTGSQTVTVTGKNLFDGNLESGLINGSTGEDFAGPNYMRSAGYVPVRPNTAYCISAENYPAGSNYFWYEYKADKTYNLTTNKTSLGGSFTTDEGTYFVRFRFVSGYKDTSSKIMLSEGSSGAAYEPYQGQSYTIDLGIIELCKIGTYRDYIYKDGADWKLHKEIGHKQLDAAITGIRQDGSAHADYASYTGAFAITAGAWDSAGGDYNNDTINARQSTNCGQFLQQNITANGGANSMVDGTFCQRSGTNDRIYMRFSSLAGKTGAELKTILSAQGGSDFYYYLATATDTVITDAALIAQLEALAGSTTYAPQTNYATAGTGTNLPVILTVEAFKNNYAGLLARLEKAGA